MLIKKNTTVNKDMTQLEEKHEITLKSATSSHCVCAFPPTTEALPSKVCKGRFGFQWHNNKKSARDVCARLHWCDQKEDPCSSPI